MSHIIMGVTSSFEGLLEGPEGRTERRLPQMEDIEGEEVLTGLRR
jgi:hypothetical protein